MGRVIVLSWKKVAQSNKCILILFQQQLSWQASTTLTQSISLLVDTGADNSIEKLTITFDDALGDVGNGTLQYS